MGLQHGLSLGSADARRNGRDHGHHRRDGDEGDTHHHRQADANAGQAERLHQGRQAAGEEVRADQHRPLVGRELERPADDQRHRDGAGVHHQHVLQAERAQRRRRRDLIHRVESDGRRLRLWKDVEFCHHAGGSSILMGLRPEDRVANRAAEEPPRGGKLHQTVSQAGRPRPDAVPWRPWRRSVWRAPRRPSTASGGTSSRAGSSPRRWRPETAPPPWARPRPGSFSNRRKDDRDLVLAGEFQRPRATRW